MAKILIVDDRVLNRQFLMTLLGYGSHDLLEAGDGAEALEKVRAERPDLVITDLLMPTMNGFEFVQRLRTEPGIARTPVIFYTATYRLDEARSLADACGVSVILPKPSEPAVILQTVEALLQSATPPRTGLATVVPADMGPPENQLKGPIAGYLLDLQLMNAQMNELVQRGSDLAEREASLVEVSARLRRSMSDLQGVSLKLAALLELGLELTAHRDPERLLEIFCHAAIDVLNTRYGALAILHDDGKSFASFKCHGESTENLTERMMPSGPRAGVLGALLDEPRARRLHNPGREPQALGLSAAHPPIQDFLGVPVATSQQVYGWFYLVDKLDGSAFSEGDEQLASTLGAQLAVAYEAVRLYDDVQRHAARLELEAHRRKQAEEKFYSAIQAAPNGMLMADGEGKITLVNDKAVELFGYGADELVGEPVEILLPERVRRPHAEMRAQYMRAPQTREMGAGRDLYGRRKDGSEFPVEVGLNPLATGEGLMILASVIDITERKKAEEALRERMRLAEFSADVSAALATQENLPAILQSCAAAMVKHLDAAFARIWTFNPSENMLELQASAGLYTHIDGGHARIPVGQFKIGLIASERLPHLTNDVIGDPRVSDQEWARREGMISFAGYPLLVEGRLIGVMAMFARKPLSPNTLAAMASVASAIAVGVELNTAETRAREHFNRIRVLRQIDRAITSTLNLEAVLKVILDNVVQFFPHAAAVGISLRNRATGRLDPAACYGMDFDEWKHAMSDSEGHFFQDAALRNPMIVADLASDPRMSPRQREFSARRGHHSLLLVPIQIEERTLGTMGFATAAAHDFSRDEIEFLSTLAGQAAVALQNADLYEETRRQHRALVEQERVQRILKELSQDVVRLSVDLLLEKLTGTIREVFRVDVSDVRFLGAHHWDKVLIAGDGFVQWLPEGGPFGRGANMWVVNHRRSLAIRDHTEQSEFPPGRVAQMFGVKGFLAAPMIGKNGAVLGVIRALSKEPRSFTPEEINLFEQFAGGAAIAIENETLYKNLEKSDRIKSEFLSVMSHELRTPLNVIMGYVTLVKDELAGAANAVQRQSMERIDAQAKDMLAMIDRIMAAAEIKSGVSGVDRQRIDAGELLEQLKAEYGTVRKGDLALIWQPPDSPVALATDCEKLKQILKSLIDNAIKFTDAGTITISARLAGGQEANLAKHEARGAASNAERVKSQVSSITSEPPRPDTWHLTPDTNSEPRDTHFVEFSVADTGAGIPEDRIPVIFDLFQQADSSPTREHEGIGLGLYLAKKYSELVGGEITVESTLGQGSVFTVTVPLEL